MKQLALKFKLHPLAVEDVMHAQKISKLYIFEEHTFITIVNLKIEEIIEEKKPYLFKSNLDMSQKKSFRSFKDNEKVKFTLVLLSIWMQLIFYI